MHSHSRWTDGTVTSGAGSGVGACADGAQLRQPGGQRPSGPSSSHRSGQMVVGMSATDTMTCACIKAQMKTKSRDIRCRSPYVTNEGGVEPEGCC